MQASSHSERARPPAASAPDGGFSVDAFDDAADVEAEVRRLLDVDGTLGTELGVAELD